MLLLLFAYVLSCCSRGFRGVSGGVSEGFPRGFRGFPRVSAILHTARTVGIGDFAPQKAGGSFPLKNFKRRNKGWGRGGKRGSRHAVPASRILQAPLFVSWTDLEKLSCRHRAGTAAASVRVYVYVCAHAHIHIHTQTHTHIHAHRSLSHTHTP